MVEILAHGTDDEVRGAFIVTYHHGVRVEREGDSPGTCRYRVTFPDGSVPTVPPDNLTADDFGDPAPMPDGPPDMVEGFAELNRSWLSEGVVALITAGLIAGAVLTAGVARLVFIVVAVGAAALLAWSILILGAVEVVMALVSHIGRRRPPR